MNPRTVFQLLFTAAIITLIGASLQIFREASVDSPRAVTFGLLVTFGVVVTVAILFRDSQTISRAYILSGTVIILSVFLINEPQTGEEAFVLFFVLTSCTALLLPIREAIVWVVALFIVQIGAIAYAYTWANTLGWISVAGGHFMFAGFGYMLRQSNVAREETEQLYAELQQTHAKLQEFTTQSQQLAVAEERNRLAREMHDSLGHRLTVAILQLEGALHLIHSEPDRAATMVGNMRDQLKEALAELRRALSSLRTPADEAANHQLNGTKSHSLTDDIQQLVSTFQEATDLSIHTQIPEQIPPLEPVQRLALFRASQELLTNVQRHAEAQQAWLDLTIEDETMRLTVADDGRGLPSNVGDGRFGLRGLGERADQLAGSFSVATRMEGGTRAEFVLPITVADAPDAERERV